VNILLLSAGGGGGNILRSVKTLFQRDVEAAQETDPLYAAKLSAAVTTRFLDTNEFSLADVPAAERVLIGPRTTGRLGARHSPDVARAAFEESRNEVEALIAAHSVIVLIATGGKGTGAGTIFPLAQIARQHRKLLLPIFVRPSFERHEVDKRRYDHALQVVAQFDAAQIRLMEILNDRGYVEDNPQPQAVVWERMNLPIARSLRGLIYVLWDLSQVDPSDLSTLFAGNGDSGSHSRSWIRQPIRIRVRPKCNSPCRAAARTRTMPSANPLAPRSSAFMVSGRTWLMRGSKDNWRLRRWAIAPTVRTHPYMYGRFGPRGLGV
jgi:cell division GTPase FtsZ